ncbi:MAG: phosphoenolpyruvate synthase, partial [Parcubacteria group bacterium]|nr:phosphoenolpyruvate synthase [Parcubacteria group bacterium]
MGDNYIAWLSDLSKKDLQLAGGKGANLGEMYNSKFPVPQAFVVTTDAFYFFLKETKIQDSIRELLNKIDVDNTDDLTKKSLEIRNIITQADMPEKLEKEILEAYDHFNIDLDGLKNSPGALAILKSARESIFVSVRSSATAEDLGDASFAGQQESFINVKGNQDLIQKVKQCFASIFTARSIFYRKKKGFEDLVGIAAIVQKMINSDKSGVIFSQNPIKNNEEILIEAVFGQGEGIVSGKIKPDQHTLTRELELVQEKISDKKLAIIRTSGGQTKTIQLTPEKSKQRVLKTYEIKQLAEYAIKLEDHYKKPQDIEFAIENEDIYILQTRPITTLKKKEGTEKEVELEGQILTEGMAASPGVAAGIVKIIHSMEDLGKIKQGDILVTTMTNPDMVVTMQKASGIVTSEGGVTAHAAIV